MDIKTIVADVAAACAQRWPDSVDASQQEVAVTLVARLSELKGELKQKKTEKQECARDFGAIKAAGGDLSAQKALMQQISSAIEHIEQQRKAMKHPNSHSPFVPLIPPHPRLLLKSSRFRIAMPLFGTLMWRRTRRLRSITFTAGAR
jgi:hypothetical protein